ncbi:YlbF family regulator [Babesia caballi]|uniref:YlbF family regulator n=1 Tax=Babesia caballi TaxID=5871 RepID=A0AAV4LRE0_BABCB|nr:YlbF family regulator [Babesia caballi]
MNTLVSVFSALLFATIASAIDVPQDPGSSLHYGSLREANTGDDSFNLGDYMPDSETIQKQVDTVKQQMEYMKQQMDSVSKQVETVAKQQLDNVTSQVNSDGIFSGFMGYMNNVGSFIKSYMPGTPEGEGSAAATGSSCDVPCSAVSSDDAPAVAVNTEEVSKAINETYNSTAGYFSWLKDKTVEIFNSTVYADAESAKDAAKADSIVAEENEPITASDSANLRSTTFVDTH